MKLSILCAASSLLLIGGCSKTPDSTAAATTGAPTVPPGKITIGYLVKQPDEPWFQFEGKGADQAAAQDGFTLIKLGAQDGSKVLAAIDSLAANGAQGFVICTPDVRLGQAIVAKAKTDGLKVISVDDQFVGADGKFMTDVPYVGMSAAKIGEASGNALAAEMKQRGWSAADTGACIITFEETDTLKQRTDGIIRALTAAGFPADHVFKAAQKTTDVPGSRDATNILLTQHPEVKHWLVAGGNDTGTLGAVRATEGRGIAAADVIGVGINGTDCIDELRKPALTGFFGSIFVSAPGEGQMTSDQMYHWIKDGTMPPLDTRSTGTFINRANFEQVLKTAGIIP